jgi:hypothetical protein
LILAALGLLALVPTKSKAQDFSFSVGVAPGYYEPGYYNGGYCDPGYGYYYYRRVYYRPAYYPGYYYGNGYYRRHIAPMSATTMINRGPMRSREKAP